MARSGIKAIATEGAKVLRAKKVKASKVAQNLADTKFMGDEPNVSGKILYGLDLLRVYNWYNYMCTIDDARSYAEARLKALGRLEEAKGLNHVPAHWINLQAGWIARILTRGGIIPDGEAKFNSKLREMLGRVEKKDQPQAPEKEKFSTQLDRVSDTLGELEELIDAQGWTIDVYEWLIKRQVSAVIARRALEFFKPVADEATSMVTKNVDPQLLEGYSNLTKAQLKQRALFYSKLISDCERYLDVSKKQRAPRKKKLVSIEKKFKSFKYQSECKDYKLASVNPEKIIGTRSVWAFNSKYKTLHYIAAVDSNGLDVKGSTLVGASEDLSKGFRIGRKTAESLAVILSGKKRAITDLLKQLKPCNPQFRSNENTVYLRTE